MTFARVKEILADAVAEWSKRVGRTPNLVKKHGPTFPLLDKTYTLESLLAAEARGLRLIQPEMIASGRGKEANLVVALRTGIPAPSNIDQMPPDGPVVPEDRIKEIELWIDGGCKE